MSTARPDRFATKTLRGDLPAASILAALLLISQIVIAGFGAASALAAAGEPRGRDLCMAGDPASADHRAEVPPGRDGQCPSAGCCSAWAGTPPVEGASFARCRASRSIARSGAGIIADLERRPLALFARAGRGPPSTA